MKKKKGRGVIRGIAVLVAIVVLIGVVYFLVSAQGRIPKLPRLQLDPSVQAQVRGQWIARLTHFQMTEKERELARLLNEIHGFETAPEVHRDKVRDALGRFADKAAVAIAENRERYLLLGDYLAFDFEQSLMRTLAVAKGDGMLPTLENTKEIMKEIHRKGGAFWAHARRRGVIDDQGRLHTREMTPAVLFRVRWRHLGGVNIEESLSREERGMYYDFVVAFTSPHSVEQRLGAITQLKAVDSSYDDLLARALVYYQGGRSQEAYRELKTAIDKGRRDAQIVNFSRSLR